MSKLFWVRDIHQVKLYSGINLLTGCTTDILIRFGYNNDVKFTETLSTIIPENGVGVLDRGFAELDQIREMIARESYFVMRIKNSWNLEWSEEENGKMKVEKKKYVECRVVNFCDLETQTEYRLATNLPEEVSNEEIGEIYRSRWQIELLWKFLKMHLKLDRMVCKNESGIELQIYMALIAYLILELVEIPEIWGNKLLDKLRYLQGCMSREISYVHWLEGLVFQ